MFAIREGNLFLKEATEFPIVTFTESSHLHPYLRAKSGKRKREEQAILLWLHLAGLDCR